MKRQLDKRNGLAVSGANTVEDDIYKIKIKQWLASNKEKGLAKYDTGSNPESFGTYTRGWVCMLDAIVSVISDPKTGMLRKDMTLIRAVNMVQLSPCDAGKALFPTFWTKTGLGPTPNSGYKTVRFLPMTLM